jgi:hypothetical protein
MATVRHAISEHDVVVLREPVGEWPAGTKGTAVSIYEDAALVEISDSHGKTLDILQVPATVLEIKRP